MQKLLLVGLGVFALAASPAVAQSMQEPPAAQSADQANAQSMPEQGTADALAAPGAEPRSYPLCSRTVTDECVNPREAGAGYGNRPLNYWPGKPASQMR